MKPRRPLIDLPAAETTTAIYKAADADISDPAVYGCPICGGDLVRVHRRHIDRLLSLIVPVRRFRCSMLKCAYEGNLRV